MKSPDPLSPADGAPDRAAQWWRWLRQSERVIFALLLFAAIFTFPDYPALSLDPSWRLVLTRAFYEGWQFGHDVVFTYGPLGFLMGNTCDGAHFSVLVGWQMVQGVAFTAIILYATEKLPLLARWACFAAFLLFGVYFDYTLHLTIVLLLGALSMRDDKPPGPRANLAIGAGLACLSAIKFTSLLLATVTVIIAASLHLRLARRKTAGFLVLGYVGGFIALWLLARQSLGHLPEYLLNSWRISRGYEESMGLPPPAAALAKALTIIGLLSLYLSVNLVLHWRRPRVVAVVLLMAGYAFITWKHGFIRADGHMGGFFIGILLLAATAPALLEGGERLKTPKWIVLLLVASFSLWGLDDAFTVTRSNAWAIFTEKISRQAGDLHRWKTFRAGYDEELRHLLATWPLEQVRATVGRASIDVLGHDAGIVCLDGLNYQPRPVFQSYSAYTPELARLNRDYYQSARAPAFVLQKLQTIDGRLLSLDDALVFRLLPQLYEFVLAEDGFLLWRRRPAPAVAPTDSRVPLSSGELAVSEPLEVGHFATKPLWLELELPFSPLGRLRAIAYQPPVVRLRLIDTFGSSTDYRLPLSEARGGFVLSPIVNDAADYLMFVTAEPQRRVRSLTVLVEPNDRRFLANSFRYSLSEFSVPLPENSLGAIVRRARFYMFKSLPVSEKAFVPLTEAEIDDRPVMVAHAPSEMRFELPPHATRITGSFGFTAGAFSDGGQTDGATFHVVWTDGRKREVLFSRQLDPVRAFADRGLQQFSLSLNGFRGGWLQLEVDPGPTGNNAWDWTAWTGIDIEEEPAK